jgi:two-component system, OmpR family, response regulator
LPPKDLILGKITKKRKFSHKIFIILRAINLWIEIVEPNQNLRSLLAWHLERAGYRVHQSPTLAVAYDRARTQLPLLAIVAADLPDGEGLDFCQWLAPRGHCLSLMLSARTEESEVVRALRAGADDYLKKPFGIPEFLARAEALLRRSQISTISAAMPSNWRCGDLDIDLVRRRVSSGGLPIDLTPQEFSLLYVLAQANGEPISRVELLNRAWDSVDNPRTVDTHILSLRKKLPHPEAIVTQRKLGYQLIIDN